MEWNFSPTAFMHGSRPSKVAHHFEKKNNQTFLISHYIFLRIKKPKEMKAIKIIRNIFKKTMQSKNENQDRNQKYIYSKSIKLS